MTTETERQIRIETEVMEALGTAEFLSSGTIIQQSVQDRGGIWLKTEEGFFYLRAEKVDGRRVSHKFVHRL